MYILQYVFWSLLTYFLLYCMYMHCMYCIVCIVLYYVQKKGHYVPGFANKIYQENKAHGGCFTNQDCAKNSYCNLAHQGEPGMCRGAVVPAGKGTFHSVWFLYLYVYLYVCMYIVHYSNCLKGKRSYDIKKERHIPINTHSTQCTVVTKPLLATVYLCICVLCIDCSPCIYL